MLGRFTIFVGARDASYSHYFTKIRLIYR